MPSSNQVVFHGSRVLLPDHDEPIEASIVVDTDKGTILSVIEGPLSGIDDNVRVIDAGDNIILPGLVEYVPGIPSQSRLTNVLPLKHTCSLERTRANALGRILDRHESRTVWGCDYRR